MLASRRTVLHGCMGALGAVTLACADATTAPIARDGAPNPILSVSNAKATARTLYWIQFSGDITSGPLGPIAFNTTNPWQNVSLRAATITFPDVEDLSGTGCGRPDPTNWGGNAGAWTAPLGISKGSGGNFTHLGFMVKVGKQTTLNLAVNSNTTSSTAGGAYILQFVDAQALLGASSPDPAADPCVTFTVTATPQ